MASMLITHQVEDFAAWKKVFDSHAGLRTPMAKFQPRFSAMQATPTS